LVFIIDANFDAISGRIMCAIIGVIIGGILGVIIGDIICVYC